MSEQTKNKAENGAGDSRQIERVVIPHEVIDLVKFLADIWKKENDLRDKIIKEHSYKIKPVDDLIMKWPVVQGTFNQIKLWKIAESDYDTKNVGKAVKWVLENAV